MLTKPRAVWLMVPAAAVDPVLALAGAAAGTRRHRHRRRQFLLPRRHPPRRRAEGQGAALRRCRRQRRRLGPGARLLPHDRRRGRDRAAPRPDLPVAGARRGNGAAHPRRHRRAGAGRTRLPALRPERRRPFREDGPQRHRVRPDGGLSPKGFNIIKHANVGLQHPARSTPKPRRCAIPNTTNTTSTSPRSPRSGGAAAWSVRGCSTSPLARCARIPDLANFRRPRLRFRRRALDLAGRDRRRRAGAGDQRRALFAGSTRAATPTTPTACCRRCASSSAAMSRSRRRRRRSMTAKPSDALVFFGATGDLAYKQIFPGAAGPGARRGA